ncbi:MAG: tail fiber domain-containing protein [Saprospiraceae bacterium]|nr:tail fiber domain-containing protein [Saprospiraceae bacterium]
MKNYLFTLWLMGISICVLSQSAPRFNYQAIPRNPNGTPITDTQISLQMSLLEGGPDGLLLYVERHFLNTGPLGLVNLQIGAGQIITGDLSAIDWAGGDKWLKVDIDPAGGQSFQPLSAQELVSVPYAQFAEQSRKAIDMSLQDLTDINAPAPSTGQVLKWDGTAWTPSTDDTGTVFQAGTGIDIAGNMIINTGDTDPTDDVTNLSAAGGDVTGTFSNLTVAKLQGRPVSNTAPTNLQTLKWSGTAWIPFDDTWGSQFIQTDATLTGNGLLSTPLRLAQQGAMPGQFLQWNGSSWSPGSLQFASLGWLLEGNAETDPATNFIGTTDNKPLIFKVNNTLAGKITPTGSNTFLGLNAGLANSSGIDNTANGFRALYANTSGSENTAIGFEALRSNTTGSFNTATGMFALFANTTSSYNTAFGSWSLYDNTSGYNNTATGYQALYNNTSGANNTANGYQTLYTNSNGGSNVAMGSQALYSNTGGNNNTGVGIGALYSNTSGSFNASFGSGTLNHNTTGSNNSALGNASLQFNTTGTENTAIGESALWANTIGDNNTASGSKALYSNTTGFSNTANGHQALYSNTIGRDNTATGISAMKGNLTGDYNTAGGSVAMFSNTSGSYNTAFGAGALNSNTSASYNTALGYQALFSNTTAGNNTATGYQALFSNINGFSNTATGYQALYSNISGNWNTAHGYKVLYSNTTGRDNTGVGYQALNANTSGKENTATGYLTLQSNTTGEDNSAFGYQSLYTNTTGSANTACGQEALVANTTGFQNTAVGANSLVNTTTGSYNTAIGYNTGPTMGGHFNTTCLGIDATATGNNMVRIGNTFVTSIGGQVQWTSLSDGRFKENVRENVPGLHFITRLRPVTYQVNRTQIDRFTGTAARKSAMANHEIPLTGETLSETTTGFIAQEVEEAAATIGFEFSGVDKPQNANDLYGLRYAEFVVPLVKAVQEQQAEIELLRQENAALKAQFAEMQKVIAAIAPGAIPVNSPNHSQNQ